MDIIIAHVSIASNKLCAPALDAEAEAKLAAAPPEIREDSLGGGVESRGPGPGGCIDRSTMSKLT